MFTGIIEALGSIKNLQQVEDEWRLEIDTGDLEMDDVNIGDSIAVNGCCLTVVQMSTQLFAADVSNESMRCTTLGTLAEGSKVNLEKAMLATDRFGGHIVSGHVDGVGQLQSLVQDGKSIKLTIEAPLELSKYIAAKGSICIDGTSLTVNEVKENSFSINIIPHTQVATIIGDYKQGQKVNLEVDLVARYLERLSQGESATETTIIDEKYLKAHGFD